MRSRNRRLQPEGMLVSLIRRGRFPTDSSDSLDVEIRPFRMRSVG